MTYKSLYSETSSASGERHLWLEVIFQAIKDASRIDLLQRLLESNIDKPQRFSAIKSELFEAQRSLSWLTTPSKDLAEVCNLAGMEVDAILDRRAQHLAGSFGVTASELLLLASSYEASINSN